MLKLDKFESNEIAKLMQKSGSFVWWYLDLMDDRGNGLVFIWFAGLPFLPDQDDRRPAAARPGLSLARYEKGRCVDYYLQEYPADALRLASSGRDLDLGPCSIRWHERGSELELRIQLDLPVSGSDERLWGIIETRGTSTQPPPGAAGRDAGHSWCPLMTATQGRAELTLGSATATLTGRCYVDSNASSKPLNALGIESWRWGRIALPERELIYYFVEAEDGAPDIELVLEIFPDGRVHSHRNVRMRRTASRRSMFGPAYSSRIELRGDDGFEFDVHVKHVVDDGPFYLRFIVEGLDVRSGDKGLGFAEIVLPHAIGKRWHQPFIRMRCHQIAGRNSMWLPLFCGPTQSRWRRLLHHQLVGDSKPILPSAS